MSLNASSAAGEAGISVGYASAFAGSTALPSSGTKNVASEQAQVLSYTTSWHGSLLNAAQQNAVPSTNGEAVRSEDTWFYLGRTDDGHDIVTRKIEGKYKNEFVIHRLCR